MKTWKHTEMAGVLARGAAILLVLSGGLARPCRAESIDELLATIVSKREEHGLKLVVKIENPSRCRILIFGADYFFGRLSVTKNGDDPWRQIGRAQNERRPELAVIDPGKEISFEYFVRVKPRDSGFELEMLGSESMLSASVGFNEPLVFRYEYSFPETGSSPWNIGFMNLKKRSVVRGQLKSNEIEVRIE